MDQIICNDQYEPILILSNNENQDLRITKFFQTKYEGMSCALCAKQASWAVLNIGIITCQHDAFEI